MKQFTMDRLTTPRLRLPEFTMQFFSLLIPFVSRGYKCKCMSRIIKYFQYYILHISFRTNIFFSYNIFLQVGSQFVRYVFTSWEPRSRTPRFFVTLL